MQRDDVLNLRVPRDLKSALKRAAERDERSMSMMVVRILREWLTTKGLYASPEATPGPAGQRRPRR